MSESRSSQCLTLVLSFCAPVARSTYFPSLLCRMSWTVQRVMDSKGSRSAVKRWSLGDLDLPSAETTPTARVS